MEKDGFDGFGGGIRGTLGIGANFCLVCSNKSCDLKGSVCVNLEGQIWAWVKAFGRKWEYSWGGSVSGCVPFYKKNLITS